MSTYHASFRTYVSITTTVAFLPLWALDAFLSCSPRWPLWALRTKRPRTALKLER